MQQEIRSSQRTVACSRLFVAVIAVGLGCAPSAMLHAQPPRVRGYITVVHPPNGFDVYGEHVTTNAETQFRPIGAKNTTNNGPMPNSVQIGAWVEVIGEHEGAAKTLAARMVLFRDDLDRKLTGLGEVDRVISTAPELVLAADGFRIRVTPATEVKFSRYVKSTADVHEGMWVLYEGKLGPDGSLVANKARFVPTYHGKVKSEPMPGDSTLPATKPQPPANSELAAKDHTPPDAASSQTEDPVDDRRKKIRFAGDEYIISADQALKSRVRRVGMSLIPHCQKQLPEDDPSKIQFDFIVIGEPMHEVHTSSDWDGLILVPAQLAARFKNDDQLAAVLADSVASRLQQRAPEVFEMNRAALAEFAGIFAVGLVPYAGPFAESIGGQVLRSKYEKEFKEQRWRVALQMMADAGYDPWQAPEAWRLAEPGKLPADTNKLKYPERSGYQFSILDLMYKKAAPADVSEGGATTSDANARK